MPLPAPLPASFLARSCPQWRQYLRVRHMYRLHAICTKNSKALFSSKNAHPHCPMAPVTQTITPSPLAPPWPGGRGHQQQYPGFCTLSGPGSRFRSAFVAVKREAQESRNMDYGPLSISEVKLIVNSSPHPRKSDSLLSPNSGATVFKLRSFRFNLAPMKLAVASGFPKGKQEVLPWRRPALPDLYPPC